MLVWLADFVPDPVLVLVEPDALFDPVWDWDDDGSPGLGPRKCA